jgi:hypothetical protein
LHVQTMRIFLQHPGNCHSIGVIRLILGPARQVRGEFGAGLSDRSHSPKPRQQAEFHARTIHEPETKAFEPEWDYVRLGGRS